MKTRTFNFDHGKFWMGEQDLAEPGDGEFQVETQRSLVSVGTEAACNSGKADWKEGQHGYSNVGRIVKMNAKDSSLKEGDRIFTPMIHTDAFNWADAYPHAVIPDGVSDEEATYVNLACVALHAVQRANVSVGQTAVIVGQGVVGQLMHQCARAAGSGLTIGVDLDESTYPLSKQLGIDVVIPPDSDQLQEAFSQAPAEATAAVFFEATGSVKALEWILENAQKGSTIVVNGTFTGELTFDPFVLIAKELNILGAHLPKTPAAPHLFHPYSQKFNRSYLLKEIEKGNLKVKDMIDGSLEPEQVVGFYEDLAARKATSKSPIIHWK